MTGTHIAYYFLCKRKLWLFANMIEQEHNSDAVVMGKHISENSYKRKKHEIQLDNIMLDFYDAKTRTIHEIKKSDKMEESHIWQLKYYIYKLKQKGIEDVTGILDYPKLKKTRKVKLTEIDIPQIIKIIYDTNEIISSEKIPPTIDKSFCKKCAYYDLCYV